MKIWKFILIGSFLLTSVSLLAADNFPAGNDHGNGGDDYSREFVNLGYDIVESLMQNPLAGIDSQKLLAVVQKTKVNSEETLNLRGFEVDAINYPSAQPAQIVLNRQGWDRMRSEPHRRAFLVLHEYLGIMGVDDSRYQISHLLDRAAVCSRPAPIRIAIEKEVKKFCYRITSEDLFFTERFISNDSTLTELKNKDFLGLDNLSLFQIKTNNPINIENNFFQKFTKLKVLDLGTSYKNINCTQFSKLENLSYISFIDRNNNGDYNENYIEELSDYCFSELPNLSYIILSLDGNNFKGKNIFQNLQTNSTKLSLVIQGVNIENLDANEFSNKKINFLTLTDYKANFSDQFLQKIKKATGINYCGTVSQKPNPTSDWASQIYCQRMN